MYTEVFSLDSKTSHFNRAVDRVKKDPQCVELLGNSKKIIAYGEPTWNKWRRARPIAYVWSARVLIQGLMVRTARKLARIGQAPSISLCISMYVHDIP
jgi:hypothetical protein